MELSTAVLNYQVLKKLSEYEKLCVQDEVKLRVDPRWLKSLRRTLSRDKKQDILIPIEQTFDLIMLERYYSFSEIDHTLTNLRDVLLITYPGYTELETLIKKLRQNNHNYSISSTKVIQIADPSSSSPPLEIMEEEENTGDNSCCKCCSPLKFKSLQQWFCNLSFKTRKTSKKGQQ